MKIRTLLLAFFTVAIATSLTGCFLSCDRCSKKKAAAAIPQPAAPASY